MIKVANATILGKISYALMFLATPNIDETTKANDNHKALQKLINQTARTIIKKKIVDKIPISELMEKSKLKTVNQIVLQQILKEIWKLGQQADHPLKNLLEKPSERTRIGKRMAFRTVGKTKIMQDSFVNAVVKMWNQYHLKLKGIPEMKIDKEVKAIAKYMA